MYDIKQFKPALYVLLLLGMSGFALAAQAPGLWVVSVGLTLLNAWLVYTGHFRPLPHLLASIITLSSLAMVALMVRTGSTPILLIGEFLVFLQLVKLFEQRANRDYAQLLILSLLLMVAASINTASLFFGLMLIGYLFLSLYCCLLFHLKIEAETARKAISIPEDKINPGTLRQDQRFLSSSMRRLTGLISSVAVVMAVLVFLFFPRWPASALIGPLQFRNAQTLTGFSESVSFEQVARITQNDAVVAYVKVWEDDRPIQGTRPLLLRGVTLDIYNGAGSGDRPAWVWERGPGAIGQTQEFGEDQKLPIQGAFGDDQKLPIQAAGFGEQAIVHQQIRLNATGSNALFAVAGASSMSAARRTAIRYNRSDETMQSLEAMIQPLEYEVWSRGYCISSPPSTRPSTAPAEDYVRPLRPVPDARILSYAQRPQVSGTDETGPLWEQRPPGVKAWVRDHDIATAIERNLRTQFLYTLDLTGVRRNADQDPLVTFLYDTKRGHCEYFAGAMTLLCQSLGLQARMVVGFKCDDYNDLSGCYVVRQNHAHTWVEVQMPDGRWNTYDPTSGREEHAGRSLWGMIKHVFDYMEYSWANNVIAYDQGRRDNLIQNVDSKMTNTAIVASTQMLRWRRWLFDPERWYNAYQVFSWMVSIIVGALLVAVGWFLYERWRLRRRAERIGLDALPKTQQLRLVRQLGFYDALLRVLEKRGIHRPPHLTPLEFSRSLSFLPAEVYDAVYRMTRIFYRVRYGGMELEPVQQRRLAIALESLSSSLSGRSYRSSTSSSR